MKEQARAKVEQLKQEEDKVMREPLGDDSTLVEIKTWAGVVAETEERRKKAEEEVGTAYYGIGIGSG